MAKYLITGAAAGFTGSNQPARSWSCELLDANHEAGKKSCWPPTVAVFQGFSTQIKKGPLR